MLGKGGKARIAITRAVRSVLQDHVVARGNFFEEHLRKMNEERKERRQPIGIFDSDVGGLSVARENCMHASFS